METLYDADNFDTLCEKNEQRMSREQLHAFCEQLGKLGFLEGTKAKSGQRLTRLKLGLLNRAVPLFLVFEILCQNTGGIKKREPFEDSRFSLVHTVYK